MDPDAPQTLRFADDGAIPNSELPVLLYRGVPEVVDGAAACEALFARSGWGAMWRDGIYPFHHFHSTAHEALGIAAGHVMVGLGGPQGESIELAAGDVAILPAGTGHRNEGDSGDLLVIGAYPRGQSWDLRRGDPAEHDVVVANIAAVPLPDSDPVHGNDGPLVALWIA